MIGASNFDEEPIDIKLFLRSIEIVLCPGPGISRLNNSTLKTVSLLSERSSVINLGNDFKNPSSMCLMLLLFHFVSLRSGILELALPVRACVRACVQGQISETVHSIIFIFSMVFRYVPGVMLVFF